MTIASDLFRTITVKINDISQQLPYIVVNQADDNGKIIRFVPLDHGQKVTGFTGARLYYPPRSDNEYGDYVTGVESDGAWDFTIPVGVLNVGRVGCNLAFIDGDGETYSRNVVFLVEPAVSGVFDSEDGQQTRLDKIIGTVQDTADTAIGTINETADNAVENINQTASDAVESIGKAEESISESVTAAQGSAEAAANSANQAATSASAAQTSERNAANSATQASQSATAAKQSEDNAAESERNAAESERNAAESERNAAESERNAASSAQQAANIVASVSGSVTQAENAAQSASQSATSAAGSASVAGGNAQSAADSASKAGESATAAKISETNAAASATAAQQAVDGFGLEVGTTTTGEPGTDAAVEIQKTGTKYTANFTIPRGDVGPAGVNENVPLGSTSGVVAQATDAYPALPRKVQVRGRTFENLWPEVNASRNGITVSVDSGVINVTGTASARVAIPSVVGSLSPGDKVTISVNKTDSNVSFDLYAYNSGSYVSSIAGISGTASNSGEIPADGFDEIRAYTIVEQGVTVDWSGMVMLVKGDTVPDVFVPSGVHTVEPTKLVAAGKNIYDESYAELTPYWGRGEFDENGDLLIYSNSNAINGYSVFRIVSQEFQLPEGDYVISASIPNIPNTALNVYDESNKDAIATSYNAYPSPTTIKVKIEPDTICTINVVFVNGTGTAEAVKVSDIQIERGAVQTSYSKPETVFVGLPADISLADGDTLTIDRDGTAQIFDFAGSGTKLENVSLPELPAPTFNVYTAGGYVPPTVNVDYEQDVNLVLQALAAKIASLEVNQTIMQGA